VKKKPWKACSACQTVLPSSAKGSVCGVCLAVRKIVRHTPALPTVDKETGTLFQPKEVTRDGRAAIVYSYDLGGFVVQGEPKWTEGSNPCPIVPKSRDERHL